MLPTGSTFDVIDSRRESPILEVAHASRFEAAKEVAFLWEDYSEYGWGKSEATEVQIAGPVDGVFELSFRSSVFCHIRAYAPGEAERERASKRREEQRIADVDRLKWGVRASLLKGLGCVLLVALLLGWGIHPADGIKLLWSHERATGRLVDSYEVESEDDRGNVGSTEVGIYRFSAGGREFESHGSSVDSGENEDVIYFRSDPQINMIDSGWKGWVECLFVSVVLPSGLIALALFGCFYFLREAARSRQMIKKMYV